MADKSVRVILQAQVSQYQASMAQATAATKHFGEEAIRTAVQNQKAVTQLGLASKSETTRVQAQIQQHQQFMQSFTQVGIAGVAMGGALAFGLKVAADAAIEFESAFAGVRKTVDGTEEELQGISDGLREMATEIPVSVIELARIAESAGALGVAKDSILEFTELAAKLGVTTDLSSDAAATGIARLTNIMQTADSEMGRLGATLVDLGNNGASTEAEILDFSLRLAGAGQIAGLTEANVLGISNAMASLGIESERGGTATQKVLLGITTAVNTGSDNLERFAAVAGLSAEEFTKTWRADPGAAFVAFVEGLGAQGQDAISVLEQLGLTDTRLVQSFLALSGAGDILRRSIELGSQAWDENTALTEEAGKRFETTASKVQLAKNELNDVAISFGSVLLPAIVAVAEQVATFASFIGDLPGPIQAIVVVLGAAAAAMLLLGGATILLLPRIEQTREAMFRLTKQTGIMRGALTLGARAITPWTLGLTAATIGIGIWINAHQEAKRRVDELTDAIEADTGALGENTRTVIINRLATTGLLEIARDLGIALPTVTDAALGNADAQDAVAGALAEVRANQDGVTTAGKAGVVALSDEEAAARRLESGLGLVNEELIRGKENYLLKAEAGEDAADADRTGADAAHEHADTLSDDLNPALEESVDLTKELKDALDALAGNQLDARQALIKWKESLAEGFKVLKGGTKTFDVNTKAGRENQKAILRQIDAAIDHGAAIAEESGSLDKGVRSVREHIRAIMEQAEQAGFSKEEIRRYIEQLNLTPKQIRTLIDLDKQKAEEDLLTYLEKLDTLPKRVRVYLETVNVESKEGPGPPPSSGPTPTDHSGGLVGASGPVRMHAGWPAMRSDEIAAILQRGEVVLSKADVSHAQAASSSGVMQVVGVLDTPFGPAQVRGVVREEMNAERRFDERLARMER